MRRLDFGIAAFTAALLAAAAWFGQPVQAQVGQLVQVVSSGSLPANQAVQFVGPNPSRHSIRICNTNATNNLWIFSNNLVAGSTLAATNVAVVSQYVLAPLASNVISCYTPPTGLVGGGGDKAIGPSMGWWGYSGSGANASVEEW